MFKLITQQQVPSPCGHNAGAVTAGTVFKLNDGEFETILPDLDFRERNGYTRTVVDVFSSPECGSVARHPFAPFLSNVPLL
jgi:hypothetical protein